MTLAPIDNRNVRAVAAERYPLNKVCSHPECDRPAEDPHHGFRRTAIGGDSWFVQVDSDAPIPHVTGLCRPHHDDITVHRSRLRLEGDVWLWFDDGGDGNFGTHVWKNRGPLSPQPGSQEAAPKRRKAKSEHQPGPERPKATYSTRVPKDELENGHSVLTELIQAHRERLAPLLGWSEKVADYYVLCAALAEGLQS